MSGVSDQPIPPEPATLNPAPLNPAPLNPATPDPATLDASICTFCTVLRRDHAFALGPGEALLALQAVRAVGVSQVQRVRSALRAVCCSRAEHLAVFDLAFDAHFLRSTGPRPVRQDALPPVNLGWNPPPAASRPDDSDPPGVPERSKVRPVTRQRPADDPDADDPDDSGAAGPSRHDPGAQGDTDAQQIVRAAASGQQEAGAAPDLSADTDASYAQAARTFLRHLHLRPARRWTPAVRGVKLDPRRTLRAALGTDGEAIRLYWRSRPRRGASVVTLIDASRSMDDHATDALHFAAALTRLSQRAHTFSFSTQLRDLTPELQRLDSGQKVTGSQRPGLPPMGGTWGGGTRIGVNLQAFLRDHADRLLSPSTLVLIVSDGLEVGDTAQLTDAVRELARRTAALVWLNPLAAHPAFLPSTRGMQAVLPYLTLLTHASTPAEYAALRVPGRK